MAKFRAKAGIGGNRTPALGPGYRVSEWRGVQRIYATQVAKKKKLSARQLEAMKEFRQLSNAAKAITPADYEAALRMSRGSQYLWRDLVFMALSGRLFHFSTDDGQKWFSMAARTNVSDILEAISQIPGSILVRGANWWDFIPPGNPGDVLSIPDGGGLPIWQEGGGTGGLSQMFGIPSGQDNTGNATKGLVFKPAVPVQFNGLQLWQNENAASTYVGKIWEYTGLTFGPLVAQTSPVPWSLPNFSRPYAALASPVVLNAGTSYAVTWTRTDANNNTPIRTVNQSNTPTGFPILEDTFGIAATNNNPQPGDSLFTISNRAIISAVIKLI